MESKFTEEMDMDDAPETEEPEFEEDVNTIPEDEVSGLQNRYSLPLLSAAIVAELKNSRPSVSYPVEPIRAFSAPFQ